MNPRDTLIVIAIMVLWGFNFVVVKLGVLAGPPLLLTALRFTFAALPVVFFVKRPAVPWSNLLLYALSLGVVKFGLMFTALRYGMPASLASLVLQTQVFFTALFALLMLGERPNHWQIGGALVAGAGILTIAATMGASVPMLPFLALIAAGAAWGIANIFTKKAGSGVDMFAYVVWSSLIAAPPLLMLSLAFEGVEAVTQAFTHPAPAFWGAVAFQAYPITLIAFAIWSRMLSRYPSGAVAPFTLMVPIIGMTSGIVVFGEPFGLSFLIGALLVFTGLLLNVLGPRFAARRASVSHMD